MTASKMHEVRMWIVQVIIPTAVGVTMICLCTDVPQKIKEKCKKHKKDKGQQ